MPRKGTRSKEGESRPSPSQADPQAKAARAARDPDTGSGQRSLPVRNLTLPFFFSVARHKAHDPFRGLFYSSSNDEEVEGAVPEPQKISNDLDRQQERYHAAELQSSNLPSAQASVPLQDPRGLVAGYTSRGAFECELVMNEPLFQENIEAAQCVLLALLRIHLKEFTSLLKKPETNVDSTPSGVILGSNPKGPLASLKPSRSFGRGPLSKDTNAKSWINSKRNLRCFRSWTSANSILSSPTSSLSDSLAWGQRSW
ncbi:unnamed protein product [Phytophthora fragariaefolia]|uniref:Unnamed protein product n=1 Tax=Phytophthora fragariaefolia TaxID=1490495 RepID=A0A9W6YCC6_9STRA|nr:unnamed protein product [Phytophthora fragariaefolia]